MCLPLFAGVGVAMGAAAGSTTAAVVGTSVVAATVAGAAMSAYGAVKAGDDAKDAANFNADIQRKQAIQTENTAADNAAQQKEKGRRLAASQVAQGAAGGIETTSGTMSDLVAETTKYSELDSLRITNNAARQAWGYKSQADLDLYKGDQAQTAGYMNAAGSILGGLGSVGMSMARFGKA